jgi:hypothetical protein
MKNTLITAAAILFFLITTIITNSCASSTGSRYDNKDDSSTDDKESTTETKELPPLSKEDFDITPYKTQITIPEKKTYSGGNDENIWFDYGSKEIQTTTKSLVGTADGYRVLILTTDNPEEANQIKADIYFSKNVNEVYVDFEPPFYKVKVGDFDSQKNADDLRFKLNQLGYKEAKVIKEKINVYK